MSKQWNRYLDEFGVALLEALGEDPYYLPIDRNPVTEALQKKDFVERYGDLPKFSRVGVCRVATICQMVVYDHQRGPEGDGQPKALRRHWYAWFKVDLAQPLAFQMGDVTTNEMGIQQIKDIAWFQRLSQTYGALVDTGEITYRDLWVRDASRMMENLNTRLFEGCHIVVAVEKDSLLEDFVVAARAMGAHTVFSGKGKSGKAGIERMIRDHYNWRAGYSPFTADKPLIILHISDHDFDGEAVIGPTFGNQASRYTHHILEARVGIIPHQVSEAGEVPERKWYRVKVGNTGYVSWAEEHAMFLATCGTCGAEWPVHRIVHYGGEVVHGCPQCLVGEALPLQIGEDTAYGFEVEALTTYEYRALLVRALLRVLPFEYIIERLRDECQANSYKAAESVQDEMCAQNKTYQALLKEVRRLRDLKHAFENAVLEALHSAAEEHVNDWRDEEDNPDPSDFEDYVKQASSWEGPWRPFSVDLRTEKLTEWLQERAEDDSSIVALVEKPIEWKE